MSLKAKLEAVIYAAEEPVTLAQLAQIFAADALELKAILSEREAAPKLDLTTPEMRGELGSADSTLELVELVEALEGNPPGSSKHVDKFTEPTPSEMLTADPSDTGDGSEIEARRAGRRQRQEREVREILRAVLDELIADYGADGRGVEIREIAGGFRLGTKPELHDAVRAFVKSLKPAMKLSLPALETLAIVAYKQPVTAPEVGEVRGVESAGVLGSLLSRKLVATAGRKQVIGRPILYKTTKEFLLRFGLKDLSELPSMEEFEKLAAMELSEESLDEGPGEPEEQVEHSGDLFALQEEPHDKEAMSIPTAAIADAHETPVERLEAEEVEVSN